MWVHFIGQRYWYAFIPLISIVTLWSPVSGISYTYWKIFTYRLILICVGGITQTIVWIYETPSSRNVVRQLEGETDTMTRLLILSSVKLHVSCSTSQCHKLWLIADWFMGCLCGQYVIGEQIEQLASMHFCMGPPPTGCLLVVWSKIS